MVLRLFDDHEEWQLDEIVSVMFFGASCRLFCCSRAAREAETIGATGGSPAITRASRPLTGLPTGGGSNGSSRDTRRVQNSTDECASSDRSRPFKSVNDVHGHNIGDALLVQVAGRLRTVCGSGITVARLGGDEFVCIFRYRAGTDAPERLAGQIVRALCEPFLVDEIVLTSNATVGVARCPIDATVPSELLRAADVAMYDGKRSGKGVYRFFHAEMDARLRERADLEMELREALEQGQISLFSTHNMSRRKSNFGVRGTAAGIIPLVVCARRKFISVAEVWESRPFDLQDMRESCLAAREWRHIHPFRQHFSDAAQDPWLSSRLLAILSETAFLPETHRRSDRKRHHRDMRARRKCSLSQMRDPHCLDDFGRAIRASTICANYVSTTSR